MSAYTGIVTGRDLLSWAIEQGVFTEDRDREGRSHRSPTKGLPGLWKELLSALSISLNERWAEAGKRGVDLERDGEAIDNIYSEIASNDLPRMNIIFDLTPEQAAVGSELVTDLRLFFEGVVSIDQFGLDGPIHGDLYYQCAFDYSIEVPEWAASRLS